MMDGETITAKQRRWEFREEYTLKNSITLHGGARDYGGRLHGLLLGKFQQYKMLLKVIH